MNWIDDVIDGLIDLYSTNNPYELCDLLGIEVKYLNSVNIILSGNNSIYVRDYFDKEVIFIRDNLNKHHEEFYLGHELGHAILHPNITNSLLISKDKLEKQANYFALKLSEINFDETELYEMTIEQIASFIEIPQNALKQLVNI